MKVSRALIGIIILIFVVSHLVVVSLFICPAPMLLSFAIGKKIEYVNLAETPDYVDQIFSSEDYESNYLLLNEYAPNARLLASVVTHRVAKKILMLRHDKFFDNNERQELYLNTLNFGGEIIGISTASDYYFQKPASDLSFEEALTLSGIYKIFK